ncbi:MAG: SusC/RagA family TonB-linked outer membrane protein [Bacteroidota bacterium]
MHRPRRRSRTIDLVSGSEYEQFIRDRVADGQLGFDDDGNLVDVEGGNTPTVIINEDGEEETIFPNNQADVIDALGGTSTDFQDLLLRTAVSQQHNLSFSGGTANTQYRASLGYLNQEGIVISSGLERLTGRLNANTQTLGGRLRLGLNLTSAVTEDDFVAYESTGGFEGGLFTNLYDFNPTFPERDANGEFFELEGQTSIRNPVGVAEEISDAARTTRTLGNISADLDLIDGLTARVNLGGDRSVSRRQIYQPNSNPIGATFNGRAIQSDLQRTSITLQSYLTYDRQIAERNNLNLLAGYEFNEFDTEFFAVEGRGFLTDANGADNIGAATSFIPEGQGCEQTATSSCREKNRLISFFGRTNYNFDQKYYISASLRYDGSSRFGPENRWALFPAISGAWRVSSESFLADNDFLTDLRVKAGFGIVGNQSIPNYRTLLLLDPASDSRAILGGEVFTGFVSPFPPNLDLQWEEKQEFTAGIEYELLQGRFFGSLEFYRNTTDNLLLEVPAATPQLGDGQFLDNFGSLRNTGLDFALDAYAIDKSDMTLQIGVVFNTNSNEIVDLGSLTEVQTGTVSGRGQSGQNALLLREGESFPVFFGPEFAGFNDEGRQLYNVYDGDGNLTGTTTDRGQATNRIIGDPRPAFSYGLRTRFDYKQFGVSMFIRGEQGRELFNNTALIFETQSAAAQGRGFFADALDNPDAFDEAPTYSSRWIENASFLRLDNITLEYRPDMSIVTPLVQSARVFLSIDNVFTITPYSGYDPEVNTNAQVGLISATGVDYTNYPRPRTFTIGVNLGF